MPSRYNTHTEKEGFTLVELSIVLVIIGLLVGGIIVGRNLIEVGEIRQQVSNIQKYTAAINVFKDKFSFLPGDSPIAVRSQFGMITTAELLSANGLGDGVISTESDCDYPHYVCDTYEPSYVFIDLSWAGLIQGSYHSMWGAGAVSWIGTVWPRLTFDNSAGIMTFTYNESIEYFLGMTADVSTTMFHIDNQSLHGVMTPQQAYAIDSKIDDGVPATGRVLAITLPQNLPATDTTAAQCVLDATARVYNMTGSQQKWCKLLIRAQ